MTEHAVVISGAGPTGLMLAGELALAGVDVALVERRLNQHVVGSRAGGLHPRSLEVLDQRGIAERFIAKGEKHYVVPFAGTNLHAGDRPTRHNYTLALWQAGIEQGLADWVTELSVPIYRGCEVSGLEQADDGVDVAVNDGRVLRARYVVGCDGGRSLVRRTAGIDFPGREPDLSYLIFEADMDEAAAWGIRYAPRGICALGRLGEGARVRGVVTEQRLERGDEPDSGELRAALIAAYGSDFAVRNVTWLSRFTDATRQAACYRAGRVLLAGDAAHVHSPVGGQGLNLGLQDAVNLGWKLAQVVKGISPPALLDTYQGERHPVAAAVLEHTLALTALNRGDGRTTALRDMLAAVMQMDGPRKWYVALMSGLLVRYESGAGHPLLGVRMPDLDLIAGGRPVRVFALLREGRPVLINLGAADAVGIDGWADRVRSIEATFDGVCELPVVGAVRVPKAILIRPDGHVAWVGDDMKAGLEDALIRWCGPPAAPRGRDASVGRVGFEDAH